MIHSADPARKTDRDSWALLYYHMLSLLEVRVVTGKTEEVPTSPIRRQSKAYNNRALP